MPSGFLGGHEEDSINSADPTFSIRPESPRPLNTYIIHTIPKVHIEEPPPLPASLLTTLPSPTVPRTRPHLPPRPSPTIPKQPTSQPPTAVSNAISNEGDTSIEYNMSKYRHDLMDRATKRVAGFLGKYAFGRRGVVIDILPPVTQSAMSHRDAGFIQGETIFNLLSVN